ncbi:hypothetical protein [Clostridium brassicae]|uniref:Uncharacterized protein n=1 Tax=Clostridium brassicae TaxID=2999072 RepID=A0ABT4D9A1_9CLOT|nr:hypothetical protein [Clostridium brassicae]MCY6958888.1 hypothetical protein [Clostridium brassicae]
MKSKKIISCLMALSIVGTSSLIFGGTAKATTIKNGVQTTNTTNLSQKVRSNYISNKGYDFNVTKDGYDSLGVTIYPEDYESHSYRADIRFCDNNNRRLDRIEDTTRCVAYRHWFSSYTDWTQAHVYLYADDDLLGIETIYR